MINIDRDLSRLMTQKMSKSRLPYTDRRTTLNRVFDLLSVGSYVQSGMMRGMIPGSGVNNPLTGLIGGLKAANPFGQGYDRGRSTNSQLLADLGWQPESTLGKVARGAVGFVGDVFLDPLTYLSFGLTGLIKGKGKVGSGVSHISQELLDSGVDLSKGMTQDIARKIVTERATTRGLQMSADDIASDADKFVNEFNDLVGLSRPVRDMTFSLANAPFGKKLFGKYADVSTRLATGEALQNIGDKTLAPGYARVRDAVLGGKTGRLFHTKSRLYQLSKTDPGAVWDMMKHIEMTRALDKDLVASKKDVLNNLKRFENLTPAEMKEVIELTEDPSKWSRFKKMAKFSDTDEAVAYRKTLQNIYDKTRTQVDTLIDGQRDLDILRSGNIDELSYETDSLRVLEETYRQQLADIKVGRVQDVEKLRELIRVTKEEINRINQDNIKYHEELLVDAPKPFTVDDVKQTINEYEIALKDFEEFRVNEKKISELRKTFNETKYTDAVPIPDGVLPAHHSRYMNEVRDKGFVERVSAKAAEKFAKQYPAWQEDIIDGKYRFTPPINITDEYETLTAARHELKQVIVDLSTATREQPVLNRVGTIEAISRYLYGDDGMITANLRVNQLDKLIQAIKSDMPREQIIDMVDSASDVYKNDFNDVFSFIAKHIGYGANNPTFKSWDSLYKSKLHDIRQLQFERDRLYRVKENLTAKHAEADDLKKIQEVDSNIAKREIELESVQAELYQKQMKRTDMLNRFRKAKTRDEIRLIKQHYEELAHGSIYHDIKHQTGRYDGGITFEEMARNKEIDNISALRENKSVFKPYNTVESLNVVKKDIKELERRVKDFDKEIVPTSRVEVKKNYGKLVDVYNGKLDEGDVLKASMKKTKQDIIDLKEKMQGLQKELSEKKQSGYRIQKSDVKALQQTKNQLEHFTNKFNDMVKQRDELRSAIDRINSEIIKMESFLDSGAKEVVIAPEKIMQQKERLINEIAKKKELQDVLEKKIASGERVVRQVQGKDYRFTREGDLRNDLGNYLFTDNIYFANAQPSAKDLQWMDTIQQRAEELLITHYNTTYEILPSNKKIELFTYAKKDVIAKNKNILPLPSDELIEDTIKRKRMLQVADIVAEIQRANTPEAVPIAREFVTRLDENAEMLESLSRQLDLAEKSLGDMNKSYKSQYGKVYRDFKKRSTEIKQRIVKLEESYESFQASLDGADFQKIDELSNQVKVLREALDNDDAYEVYMRTKYGDARVDEVIAKSASPDSVGRIILDANATVNDKVRDVAQFLRDELSRMGELEVGIGKLHKGQLEVWEKSYLPHILTEHGEKIFENTDEVIKKFPSWGDDLGYGMEFSPHSKTRSITSVVINGQRIDNPNIMQINEAFLETYNELLKGKNAFQENVAEIYNTRAMKHLDLMYDNYYMNNMMLIFGDEYIPGLIKEGYSNVMNFGKLREVTGVMARLNVSMEISDDITNHLRNPDLQRRIRTQALEDVGDTNMYKKRVSELINAEIAKFLDENYPDVVRRQLYTDNIQGILGSSDLSGALDDLAIPMVELNHAQIKGITDVYGAIKIKYFNHIKNHLLRFASSKYYEMNKAKLPKQIETDILRLDNNGLRQYLNNLLPKYDEIDTARIQRIISKLDVHDGLDDLQIRNVNEAIVQKANQSRKLQIIKDHNRFLDMYDKFTHFIKLQQTAVIPAFHLRNKMSNMFNSWLVVGGDAVNVDFQRKAWQAIKQTGDVNGVLKITNLDGTVNTINWSELYDIAKNHNVIDDGYYAADLGVGRTSRGLLKKYIDAKYDVTDTKNFFLYKKAAKFGGSIENQDKLIHFASQVSRGMSYEDAAKSTERFLFDYSDLTAFEQNVMKRVMPYYTWLRKNAPLQVEMILEHPEKYRHIAKVKLGIEGMVNEDEQINKYFVNEFAKDWVQTPFHVTNEHGQPEPVLWNPNLPFMDIGRIPDVFNLGESAKELFTQTNPIFKTPIEQIINRNVFFDSPIVQEGESAIGSRLEHLLSQLSLYNVGQGFITKDGVDLGLHTLNTTSGVKMLSYDYETYKRMKIQEMLEQKRRELRGHIE